MDGKEKRTLNRLAQMGILDNRVQRNFTREFSIKVTSVRGTLDARLEWWLDFLSGQSLVHVE
jgi:hypothetical protein